MSCSARERLILVALLAFAALLFGTGLRWGLPSREPNPEWSGRQILEKGGQWSADPHRAADADADPLVDRSKPLWLNQTDRQKAQILRRYRLFSAQPDEMVTFMALAGMPATRGDPRMYQYGGLWIYPVGALIQLTLHPRADMAFYLDHPEEFAKFYVVARAYSGLWGLVGVWAVFQLMKRFSSGFFLPAIAAIGFSLMPIVISGAHEAKPHLGGAVLVLLCALAATKCVETGQKKWAMITGILCGLATGMVLSAAVSFVIVPLMASLRPSRPVRTAAMAFMFGVLTYCMTNPFVPINLIRNPDLVRANLGALSQAKAIVGKSSDLGALANARRLITDGASLVGGVVGITALLVAAVNRDWWTRHQKGRPVAILLGIPSALVLIQFTLLAAGKPGEFGRFAILPDIAMLLAGLLLIASLKWSRALLALTPLAVAFSGLSYLAAFMEDSTRTTTAQKLDNLWNRGARTLGVRAEPAPYCLPPVDLDRWKIILLPGGAQSQDDVDIILSPVDQITHESDLPGTPYRRTFIAPHRPWLQTRISWADKPFELLIKRDLFDATK